MLQSSNCLEKEVIKHKQSQNKGAVRKLNYIINSALSDGMKNTVLKAIKMSCLYVIVVMKRMYVY